MLGRELHTPSCHQITETADLIGGQRPVRNRTTLKVEAWNNAVSFSPTNDVGGCILVVEQTLEQRDGHPQILKSLDGVATL